MNTEEPVAGLELTFMSRCASSATGRVRSGCRSLVSRLLEHERPSQAWTAVSNPMWRFQCIATLQSSLTGALSSLQGQHVSLLPCGMSTEEYQSMSIGLCAMRFAQVEKLSFIVENILLRLLSHWMALCQSVLRDLAFSYVALQLTW